MSAALVFVAGALVTMRMRAGARRTQAYLSFTYGRGADYAGVWVVAGCVVDSWPRTVVLDHTSEVRTYPKTSWSSSMVQPRCRKPWKRVVDFSQRMHRRRKC